MRVRLQTALTIAAALGWTACNSVCGISDLVYTTEPSSSSTGSGGGGMAACEPLSTVDCYADAEGNEGDPATRDVGPCAGGTATCSEDGLGYGSCDGAVLPAFDTCATAEDEDCDGEPGACSGELLSWSVVGGVGVDRPTTVAVDEAGVALVAGQYDVSTNPSGPSLFVARYAPDGGQDYLSTYAATGAIAVYDAVLDADGSGVIAGVFQGTLTLGRFRLEATGLTGFVAKLDPDGEVAWAFDLEQTTVSACLGVALDDAGGVVVGGFFTGPLAFAGQPPTIFSAADSMDVVVLWVDGTSGQVDSARSYGTSATEELLALRRAPDGRLAIAGSFSGATSLDGEALQSFGAIDAFAGVLAENGEVEWARSFGGSGTQLINAVAVTASGALVVAGRFQDSFSVDATVLSASTGELDPWVATIGPNDSAWARAWATHEATAYGPVMALDPFGDVMVAAAFSQDVDFGSDVTLTGDSGPGDLYAMKLDPSGTTRWVFGLPDASGVAAQQYATGVGVDGLGRSVVVGAFYSSVLLDGAPAASSGSSDVVILRLEQ